MKVVFTGGGTGGHVYPNIAIYEKLKEQYPDAEFLYIGTKRGAESKIVRSIPQPIPFKDVKSKGLPQQIKSLNTLLALFFIFLGTIKSYFLLKKFKPDFIVGSGGYVAAPVLFAASILRLKVFIHEQNAVPGRLNRFIARFAARVGVSFASTACFFPADKVVVTGYPLRKSIRFSKNEDIKRKYDIPEKNKVIFVFGGSGGARSINNAMAEIIPTLLAQDDITVILSTGRGFSDEYKAYDETISIFEEAGIPCDVKGRLIIQEYFDNIDEIYSISDLIVSRAGAGTIKEITTLGIPSILIPKINLPGDHQILNAREVEKIGGAKVVYESVFYNEKRQSIYVPEVILLNAIRETLSDSDALFYMRKKLRQVEKQNSTDLILKELEQLMKGKEKADHSQIKVFYLQPKDEEKSIELIFDTTTVGNSYFCDTYLDGGEDSTLLELKVVKNKIPRKKEGDDSYEEQIIVRRLKGTVCLDGEPIVRPMELKEDSLLQFGTAQKTFQLKSYLEKVEKIHIDKSTASNIMGSSLGIMFSRFGGMMRDVFIAAFFGAGRAMDIFALSLTVAYFMRRIVAENALENAFLPIFSRIFHRTSRKKTWEAASSIVNFTLLLSLLATALLLIFAPAIINTIFPDLAKKGMAVETIKMTRLIMPYLFLITVASVLTTYLKAFNRFGIAEASSIFFSIGIITGILLFHSSAGLYSLAYGVLISGFMQILFLMPFIVRIFKIPQLQFSYKLTLDIGSTFNKKYYAQLTPITIDVILSKTSEIVSKGLAVGLSVGSVSFLHYALAVYRLPFAIISQAINSVVLKEFSETIALFDKQKARQLFLDGIKTNIFLLTPISVLMIVLAEPVISVLFERGSFNHQDVINTALALKFYAVGLVGWGIQAFTARIFSARIDVKTSMLLNFFMLVVNVTLAFLLVKTKLTFAGLALATSLAFLLFSVIRTVVLQKKLYHEGILIKSSELLVPTLKTLLATVLMVIVLMEAKYIFYRMNFQPRLLGDIILLTSLTFIGVSVYLLASLMLKNTELLIFKRKLLKKNGNIPLSMMPPGRFLDVVSKNVDAYKDDYFYKINIYLSSSNWEVRNVGIKLVGLFKDTSKLSYLLNILKAGQENGFVMRNTINAMLRINPWNPDIKKIMSNLLKNPYYEVRAAALLYLGKNCTAADYAEFKAVVHKIIAKASIEEKLAGLKLIARTGDKDDLRLLEKLFLGSNSLVREELLELLHGFYRRKVITSDELKEYIAGILITSNNLSPEFKLKSIIKKIYKEIE